MMWIGITGGIACGKSSVVGLLRARSFPVLSADDVVHQIYAEKSEVYTNLINFFGEQILDSGKNIDRRKLAEIVSKDAEKLRKLESIVHPIVQSRVRAWKDQQKAQKIAFYEVPLLFEKNMENQFDKILCVVCSGSKQVDRLMKRSQLSEEEAKTRIAMLLPNEEKAAKSDFVIENNSSEEDLSLKIDKLLQSIN